MTEVLQGEDAWRERAMQLQFALDTRVVIEQAKGMLRERLGLSTDGAFELLRASARSHRQKLHALAREVVESFATPQAVVNVIGLHPDIFKVMSREERVLQTEEFFRNVNEVIARKQGSNGSPFLCECANPYCNVTFDMSADDLTTLHSGIGYFVVTPGHEIPDLEEVVQRVDGHAIMKKRTVD
ncbi:MAG: ANTAR domain-containing protein [Gaiellaceae bacterium]